MLVGFTLFYLMFWSWLTQWGFDRIPFKTLLAGLYGVRSIQLLIENRIPKRIIIATCLLVEMMGVNLAICGIGPYFFGNISQLAYGVLALLYWCCLIANRKRGLLNCLDSLRWPINIVMVINIAIMFLQLGGTYYLMNRGNIINAYYPDLIAGLFGQNGTHRLTLFYAFCLLLNLRAIGITYGANRKLTMAFLSVSLLGYSYLSTQNDNIMFFPILVVIVLFYLWWQRKLKVATASLLILGALALFAFSTTLASSIDFSQFLNRVGYIIESYSNADRLGSENRVRIISILFNEWDGLLFGSGLGGVSFYNDLRIDPLHFGMCSAQSLIGMGGLLFYLAVTVYFAYCVALSINRGGRRRSLFASLVLFFTCSYYTILYSQIYNLVPLLLVLLILTDSSHHHEPGVVHPC